MDFAKRLSRVVAAATWSSLLLAIAGVLVMNKFDPRVHVHLIAFWLWCIVGALVAMALSILPVAARHNTRVEELAWIYRLALLCADVLFVSAVVAVSGGLNGPMWMLYVPLVLFASVATRQWQGLLVGFASSVGLVIAGLDSDTLTQSNMSIVLVVASVTGSLVGVGVILSAGGRRARQRVVRRLGRRALLPFMRRAARRTELPFGPFLAAGALLALYAPALAVV